MKQRGEKDTAWEERKHINFNLESEIFITIITLQSDHASLPGNYGNNGKPNLNTIHSEELVAGYVIEIVLLVVDQQPCCSSRPLFLLLHFPNRPLHSSYTSRPTLSDLFG